jgi:KH domain-containing protein
METILINKTLDLKKNIEEFEEKLKVKLTISGKKVTISGEPLDEYEAMNILEAISSGFSVKKALLLTDVDLIFRKIHIKDFTRRKDLKSVRARIIGKEGKTKHTLENIANCEIAIQDNTISIIGTAESIDNITTAIKNIVRGTKQANAYNFLERINTQRKGKAF